MRMVELSHQIQIFLSGMKKKGKERKKARTAIIIAVPSVIAMMLTIGTFIFLRMKKSMDNFEIVEGIQSVESLQYDLSTIRAATNNFSDANKLGKGGFGIVYKARVVTTPLTVPTRQTSTVSSPPSPPTHKLKTATGQGHDGSKRPAGLHREKVASHSKNLDLLQPREVGSDCMQTPCMATCPSAEQLTPSFQDMQHLEKNIDVLHSTPAQPKQLLNNASLIGPKLFNTHSDRP
nr:cysteine-rich receptor-like protein kinase 11 [Quercus suber]